MRPTAEISFGIILVKLICERLNEDRHKHIPIDDNGFSPFFNSLHYKVVDLGTRHMKDILRNQ